MFFQSAKKCWAVEPGNKARPTWVGTFGMQIRMEWGWAGTQNRLGGSGLGLKLVMVDLGWDSD